MEYVDHLAGLIRKSTFKLPRYTNGWIDLTGHYHPLQSHHHVEEALKLIKQMDHEFDCKQYFLNKDIKDIESCKRLIPVYSSLHNNIKLSLKANKNLCKTNKVDGFQSAYEYAFMNSTCKNDALKFLNIIMQETQQNIDDAKKWFDTHHREIEKFERANKNKGYDAAEYIIVNHGYIAVEDSYLLYRNAKSTQLVDYNCYVEKDDNGKCVICKLSQTDITRRNENKKKRLIKLADFYIEPSNRFHCPSGFTRIGYERWLNDCRKVGLDGEELIYNKTYRNY